MFWQANGAVGARRKVPHLGAGRAAIANNPCGAFRAARATQPILLEVERLLKVYLARVGAHAHLLATLDRTPAPRPG